MDESEVSPDSTRITTTRRVRQLFLALIVMMAIGAGIAVLWLLIWSKQESTDNAYVAGHQVLVSARTPGTVRAVHVEDTDSVQRGQLLVELDGDDAAVGLERARANLLSAVGQARQQKALIATRAAELRAAQADFQRRAPLRESRALSPEVLQHAKDRVDLAREGVASAKALWIEGGISVQPGVSAARAAYIDAALNVARIRVTAPTPGVVVQRTAQVGQQAEPGLPLLRLVPLDGLWIDANFKETQLTNVRIGQPAEVTIDLYGTGTRFKGHVAGFSAGTGSAFAVLPPQNAAGNWVKVVQRVPVRIVLDPDQIRDYPLRLGLSVRVRIDTHDRSGPRLRDMKVLAEAASTGPSEDLLKAEQDARALIDAD